MRRARLAAAFYTTGVEHGPSSATGHVGADALARDAADGAEVRGGLYAISLPPRGRSAFQIMKQSAWR